MARTKCRWQCPSEWSEWSNWLAAGLHAGNRWRLPVLLLGMLFARGRRTISTWLRAAGVSDDYYYFLAVMGRKSESVATWLVVLILRILPLLERLLAVIDDSPTKRYWPKVEDTDIHRHPTPGRADQKYVYGHIWVTISLAVRHPCWGALALPLRWAPGSRFCRVAGRLCVRQQTMAKIPKQRQGKFRTRLRLAAKLLEWIAPIVGKAGKTLWVVVDGFSTKCPFPKRSLAASIVVVGRLRCDAAPCDLPPRLRSKRRGRGRPRKYGKNKISLAKCSGQKGGWQTVECTLYGERVTKTVKTFLATYRPVAGVIRVLLVKEDHGWFALCCTDWDASMVEILEAFAERATIE